jgi:hypothetical protein
LHSPFTPSSTSLFFIIHTSLPLFKVLFFLHFYSSHVTFSHLPLTFSFFLLSYAYLPLDFVILFLFALIPVFSCNSAFLYFRCFPISSISYLIVYLFRRIPIPPFPVPLYSYSVYFSVPLLSCSTTLRFRFSTIPGISNSDVLPFHCSLITHLSNSTVLQSQFRPFSFSVLIIPCFLFCCCP